MGPYKGDYPTGFAPPLVFMFSAFDSNDPSASVTVTGLAVGDIKVFKDGGLTERSSTAGYAVDTDVDGIVGVHFVSIDIDNNDDAGFFAAGSEYDVVVSSITIDSATVNFHVGSFSIERAGGALAKIQTVDTVVDGIAAKLVGITLLNEWLGLIAGKQAGDTTAVAEVKATGAGSGTYDPTTDSTEALRDHIADGTNLSEAGGDGDHLTEAGGDGDHLTESGGTGDQLTALAQASVLGALNNAAAAGEVTTADTLMQYIKQLINILIGAPGIAAFPSAAAPANAVSLAEVIRIIYDKIVTDGVKVDSINTDAVDAVAVDVDVYAELLDLANGVDTGLTVRQHLRLAAAAAYGKASGLATTTAKYRNIPDDVDAITATVDGDGNRSAVTLDKT